MQKSTDMWFRYLNERTVITEGLRDIGLPEHVIDYIEEAMPEAPEKSKVLMGNLWKNDKEYFNGLKQLQFDVVNYMIEDFRDYIQVNRGEDNRFTVDDITVRTVEPFDINKGTNAPRVAYDDERIEQGKRVKFVIQNVKNGVAKPFGTWRKMIMKAVKALSKVGIPSEKVETAKETLNGMLQSRFRNWWNRHDVIAAFLNDDPTNYELAKDAIDSRDGKHDADELLNIAKSYLENKENPEDVMHEFDDGSYWYNLQTSNCSVEAERMGHCGSDSRGVLVSLRKRKGKRRESSSYVTMTWGGNTLYQIKGRQNDAPPEEVWDHIAWFINNYDIETVEETGEHSNDFEGFEFMNDYLSRNTNASFQGNIEEILEQVQDNVDGVDQRFYDQRDEAENVSIGCTVETGEDMGGDPRSIYLYMSCDVSFQIDLGWPGFETRDGMYRPTTGPDSTEPLELEDIPINTWGSEAREFEGETGLDDLAYELPGEDQEVEWNIRMLQGVQNIELSSDDPRAVETAHLEITIRSSLTEYSDVDDPGDVSEYDNFADEMLAIDENHAELAEKIRRALVQGQYISKNAYDRAEADLAEMQLKNFKVYQDDTGVEFWFTPTAEAADANLVMSDVKIPAVIKQYVVDFKPGGDSRIEQVYGDIFGGRYSKKMESETLNNRMAAHIQSAYRKQEKPNPKQLQMQFGPNYRAPDPRLVLAKDSRFIIVPQISYSQQYRQRYPDMGIAWKYTIGVNSKSPEGEVEVVKDIVEFLDENPQLIMQAANEIIEYAIEPVIEQAEKNKDLVFNNQEFVKTRERIKSMYAAMASDPEHHAYDVATRIMLQLGWFEENYADMTEQQRFVMWKHYLKPMASNRFRGYGAEGQVDVDTGKPRNFDDYVYQQVQKLGAATQAQAKSATTLRGTLGEPRPAQESIERQIARIDSLLSEADPSYDLRIYNIQIGCTVSKDVGGTESETATEIRGIPGVTTVRPVAARKRDVTPTAEYVLYDIKFELLGARSRVEYRDEILLPAMRKIRGLKLLTVSSMHRTNRKGTIRTVRESKVLEEYLGGAGGFGGRTGVLGGIRNNYGKTMSTPRSSLQNIVDDWAQNGVMSYDTPTDSRNMRYHVMMPVSELLPYVSRVYRGDKRDFDGRYKNFIRTGAQNPVFVAIGKLNGRVKITGNEDLLWFAKRSGLQEVPVFFSFQRQV